FDGTLDCAVHFNVDASVMIVAPVCHDPGANSLHQGVPVSAHGLQNVTDATIEIIVVTFLAPEGGVPDLSHFHSEPRHRAVELPHHLTKLFTVAQVSQRVVVIIHQGGDPWDEAMEARVVIEAIPESRFGWVGRKKRDTV